MRRMIFHIPLEIDKSINSASQIRPYKMLNAFQSIGYMVEVIEGNGSKRKVAIKKIKRDIKNGVKYDFVYSESSTMPTLLTESHHLPTHPFLDFDFFNFCSKHGIPIGLFYRDIYWAFPENTINWKSKIAKFFYLYDLKRYSELIDVLFLPSIEMSEHIPLTHFPPIYELPSGTEIKIENNSECDSPSINLFYVGGIGHHYDLTMIVRVLKEFPKFHLTICCREADWERVKKIYQPLISENISIVHESGEDLNEYYKKADLCILFVEPSIYREFAMPYKLFEYIGRGKPVLASKGTKVAQFVEKNKCGISAEYNEEALRDILSTLSHEQLRNLQENVVSLGPSNSWEARAREVAKVLKH